MLSDPLPDVAVTTTGYDPAGVPVAGLICGPDPPPPAPHAAKPAAIVSRKASKSCGTRRCARPFQKRRVSTMKASANAIQYRNGPRDRGLGPPEGGATNEVTCGIVAIESVTIFCGVPAGNVAEGKNAGIVFAGNPDVTANVTALVVVTFAGTNTRLKFAVVPADTGGSVAGGTTLKSKTVTACGGAEVPPPGIGFFTVIFSVVLCAKSLAGRAAVRDVGLM